MRGHIEAFWHPSSDLVAIGIAEHDLDSTFGDRNYEYAVFTAVDEATEPVLASVIEPRPHPFWSIIRLPKRHRYINVRLLSETESAAGAAFMLVSDADIQESDLRTAAIVTAPPSHAVHVRSFSDLLPVEKIVQTLSPRFGEALVSIASHRQSRSDGGGPTLVGEAKLIWPLDSRVQIEALPVVDVGDDKAPSHHPPPGQTAIRQYVATERPPRARLRFHLGGAVEPSLARFSLVHVMHQRRFFEIVSKQRESSPSQGLSSEPQVEALSLATIRAWLKDDCGFDAVEADKSLIVASLAGEIATADKSKPDINVRLSHDSSYVDVEFMCAAVGDDVGIASSLAQEGDLTVRTVDSVGDPRIRLFRVGINRLEPMPVQRSDNVLRTVMAHAMEEEAKAGARAAQPAVDTRRWGTFLQHLGLPSSIDRLNVTSNPIGALLLAAWAEAIQGRHIDLASVPAEFQQYRRAPALVTTLYRFPHLRDGTSSSRLGARGDDVSLPRQIAAVLGAAELVPESAPVTAWEHIWRILMVTDLPPRLIDARICLDGTAADLHTVRAVVKELHDEERVKTAFLCSSDRNDIENAAALQTYLERRSKALWTPLSTVARLPSVVRELLDDSLAESDERPALTNVDERDFATTLADFQHLLAEAAKILPLDGNVRSIVREFESRQKNNRLDRRILRQMEQKLTELLGVPDSEELAKELTTALETWAGLPNFAGRMKPRLRLLADGGRHTRDVVEAIVNRVRLPKPGNTSSGFEAQRNELARRIRERLASDRRAASDPKELADDIADYGDILLHHRAWLALQRFTSTIDATGQSRTELDRLRNRMTNWPLQAAQIWQEAIQLDRDPVHSAGEQLSSALTLPDFRDDTHSIRI